MKAGIKVFAPASVGNFAVGFDCLGFALEKPGDEIIARFSEEKGLRITKITGAGGKLSANIHENTAGIAAYRLLEHLGETERGIELELHKKMPFASGLGSSAASAVAGVMAINELLRRPLEKRELLPFAMQGEQYASQSYHADNVAPSLLGGIVLIRDNPTLDVHRLPAIPGLQATVVYPQVAINTKDARTILSNEVSLKKHVQQSANLGGLITGLFRMDLELIRRSLQDVLIEPQRAPLIPKFYEAQKAALELDALGCSISGSGPSIFALSANSLIAERIAERFARIYSDAKIPHKVYTSLINHEGAIKF